MISVTELARHWGITHQSAGARVKQGCPLDSFEAADLWRQANQKREPRKKPKLDYVAIADKLLEPMPIEELEKQLEAGKENLVRCKIMLDQAFTEGSATKVSTWMNLYHRALESVVKGENLIREAKVQAGILIPITQGQSMIRKVVEVIMSRLTRFPQNVAPRCNPSNPGHAMDVLQAEITGIIEDVRRSI